MVTKLVIAASKYHLCMCHSATDDDEDSSLSLGLTKTTLSLEMQSFYGKWGISTIVSNVGSYFAMVKRSKEVVNTVATIPPLMNTFIRIEKSNSTTQLENGAIILINHSTKVEKEVIIRIILKIKLKNMHLCYVL